MKKIREIYINSFVKGQEAFIFNIYKTRKERIYGKYWRKIDVHTWYILFNNFSQNENLYF
jgi:hypothetical protein